LICPPTTETASYPQVYLRGCPGTPVLSTLRNVEPDAMTAELEVDPVTVAHCAGRLLDSAVSLARGPLDRADLAPAATAFGSADYPPAAGAGAGVPRAVAETGAALAGAVAEAGAALDTMLDAVGELLLVDADRLYQVSVATADADVRAVTRFVVTPLRAHPGRRS
jgi:hypothetical protein